MRIQVLQRQDFEHDVVVLLEGLQLLLVVLSAIIQAWVPAATDHFEADLDVQLIEAFDGLSEALIARVQLLIIQSSVVVELLKDVQDLIHHFQSRQQEFKVLVLVGDLAHALQKVRKDFNHVQFGLVALQELLVELLELKDGKRNQVD